MFVSILKMPAADTSSKEMGLIDMAAGYFAYLEYSTDSILSFSFIRNIAQWARQATSKLTSRDGVGNGISDAQASADSILPVVSMDDVSFASLFYLN